MAESLDGQGALLEEDIEKVWKELMEEFSRPKEEKEGGGDEEVEDAGEEKVEEGEDALPPLEPLMDDYVVKHKEEWEEEDYIPEGQEEYVWMMNSKGKRFEFK